MLSIVPRHCKKLLLLLCSLAGLLGYILHSLET